MYGSRQFGGAQDAPRPETQALGLVPMVIETSGRGERSNHGTMLNMLHRILSLQHPSYKKRGTVVGRETQ